MKTPVFKFNKDNTAERMDKNIRQKLTFIEGYNGVASQSIQNLCFSLCHKLFYVGNISYEHGKQYLIMDMCDPIQGMFKNEMISFVNNLIKLGLNSKDASLYKNILRDCLSYELIQILFRYPVQVYAALLKTYVLLEHRDDEELLLIANSYISQGTKKPTLEWEEMYLLYILI